MVIVMVLPFWMLKNLQVRRRQKAALAFIFSFAMFCIILDILRTVQALRSKQALYTVLELNLNVMIACLPTYRALLNMEHLRKFSLISRFSSWASSKASFGKNSYGKNDTWESKDSEGHSLGSSGSLSSTNRDYPARYVFVGRPEHLHRLTAHSE